MCSQKFVSRLIIALIAMTAVSAPIGATPPHIKYDNVIYAPGQNHDLDLYIPTLNPCGDWPVVIFIFGGGWQFGTPEAVDGFLDELLARRFAVAAINYRYSVHAIFPAQIEDVQGGIRWLRANAATYDIDPTRFAIFGESSGGHLASLVGSAGDQHSFTTFIGGNSGFSSAVQAVGVFAGHSDLKALLPINHSNSIARLFGFNEWWQLQQAIDANDPIIVPLVESANPAVYVTPNDPPYWIVNGELDQSVPPFQAQYMHNALVAAGVPSSLSILNGIRHTIPLSYYLPVFDAFEQLLDPPPLGDINCDGGVDTDDLLMLLGRWGPCGRSGPCSDLDGDNDIDTDDLLILLADWGA